MFMLSNKTRNKINTGEPEEGHLAEYDFVAGSSRFIENLVLIWRNSSVQWWEELLGPSTEVK